MNEVLKFLGLEEFVSVDVETTGLLAEKESIIEYAFVRYKGGKPQEKISALCRPEKPIPLEIQEITGITNEMVKDKKHFKKSIHIILIKISSFY